MTNIKFVKVVATSQETVSLYCKKQTLFVEIITAYSENHKEPINVCWCEI